MSGPPITALASSPASVRADIEQAARRTGENFDFLLAQARIESSLNPEAKASTSSAAGLYQFTDATWLQTLKRHGTAHGYGWASAAISGGRVADPTLSAQIMALRYDPTASSLMAGELAGENRTTLARTLGREPNDAELYLGHFLGSGDAGRFLSAHDRNPEGSATALLPKASAANAAIFLTAGGHERSIGEVMDLIAAKLENAKGGDTTKVSIRSSNPRARLQARRVNRAEASPIANAPQTRSMADTLAAVFGGNEKASHRPAVKLAYERFERFGL